MSPFDSSNCYQSSISGEPLEKKLSKTENYLSIQRDFIEFQNWCSEKKSVVLDDEIYQGDIPSDNDLSINEILDDEELASELAQLFSQDNMLEDDELASELDRLEEYLAEYQTVLVACPKNMPRWENAWWGERVLRELG